MDIIEKLQIVREIVDFWHDVDLNWGANAHNYFPEDCSYTTSMTGVWVRRALSCPDTTKSKDHDDEQEGRCGRRVFYCRLNLGLFRVFCRESSVGLGDKIDKRAKFRRHSAVPLPDKVPGTGLGFVV
jgi:hypothetical protein